MTVAFVVYCIFLAVLVGWGFYAIQHTYQYAIDGLRRENRELRDRLYQKHALPPSGVDLSEKYEARAEKQRVELAENKNKGKQPLGPIERLTSKWTESDRALSDRNVDATKIN